MKIKTINSLIAYTIILLLSFNLSAISQDTKQNKMPTNIGFYGGAGLNFHSASFYPGITTQPGTGLFGGIIGNFPLTSKFVISGRIGYFNLDGIIKNNEPSISETLDANLGYVEVAPILNYYFLEDKPLYLLGGIELGVPIVANYDYSSSVDPNIINFDIENKATRLALALGAGYNFNITKNIFLTPEISYRFPLSKVSSSDLYDAWNVSQLRLGVNLTFSLNPYEEQITPREEYKLELGSPELSYYDDKMMPKPLNKINVEEVQYSELFPLLPYVFFPEKKAVPDPSIQTLAAQNEAGEFTIDDLNPDAFKINTYTLDIIGKRLQENPNATITITGTLDSKELKKEKNLSKERADFCKNYLVANYNIAANRINVVASGMPSNPSNKNDVDGDAENRRAEITSDNFDLMKPIVIFGDKERVTNPSMVNFKSEVITNDTLDSWKLVYRQSGDEVEVFSGIQDPGLITWQIKPNQLKSTSIPVDWEYTVKTKSGITKKLNGSIPSDYFSFSRKKSENLPDKTISKFSLVLFDFDSPKISEKDKQIIDKNILPVIAANSTVQIYGYTDKIGDFDYNKNLATRRADAVKNYLATKVKNVKFESYGVGEGVQIFNNDQTLGRQLSRTVQIYVVTPKK